jgi:hypothetical protein
MAEQPARRSVAEMRAWGERPDAFEAITYCAAVGWVGGEGEARARPPDAGSSGSGSAVVGRSHI